MSIPSPCVKFCRIQDGVCAGCKRTLSELTDWYKLSDQEKSAILEKIKQRA